MISNSDLKQILGPDGPIAQSHPSYEFRAGQIKMAQAVAAALDEGQHLCVEAGTGTGKTLAYLLPSLHTNKRVIISTGTKALQEQVYFKDIPFLEGALNRKLSVCYVKGRSNYLCLKKLAEVESQKYLFSPHDPAYLKVIREWTRKTSTGDRAELKDLPEDFLLWHHINARRETCTGQKCSDFDGCFVTKVRQKAQESDIIIVNHHLFFADLALRQGDFGSVLPDYSYVIFDEAHELEDIATQYFGTMVSNYRLEELTRDTRKALEESGESTTHLETQLAKLAEAVGSFFRHFVGKEGRFTMQEVGSGSEVMRLPENSEDVSEPYRELLTRLALIESGLANVGVKSDEIEALVRRSGELQKELRVIFDSDSLEHVYWYEIRGRGVFVWASPICVSQILKDHLFENVESAVLTSATLSTGGNFQFIRRRLGLENAEELILQSHFDFGQQAIFYIPKHIPEPRDLGWIEHACKLLETILTASNGRAFVLFTSYSQMENVHKRLKDQLEFPTFVQGEMSKIGLLEAFRKTPNSVLFATNSFWQGVDVQGEQLSCVVIDKLPFSVPSDPIVAARIRYLNQSGANAFFDYQLPEAVILLKQGLGRLIRSKTDRGILALLDKRVFTRRYGRIFLDSLPPAPITHDAGKLSNFFLQSGSITER